MKPKRRVQIFVDRYPFLGPVVWILSVQYFIAQVVVAAAWPNGYSWQRNFISDLGSTICGQYSGRAVCSPDHTLMNSSFILLGVTMALGSLLIYQEFRAHRASRLGFGLMALGGVGSTLVGLFPENVVPALHATGAVLALLIGNISLVVLAFALKRVPLVLRCYTAVSGVFSIMMFILFTLNIRFGLGQGTLERLVSYPQTIWLIGFGLYMMRSHGMSRETASRTL
ncbi:MAG TPA: DUF998 domain-containing protein [Candidatus Saccharimonadales bacterium]|nr:DUF998 domain-containing protein [Candidatus Saccharimonadales bacterium]